MWTHENLLTLGFVLLDPILPSPRYTSIARCVTFFATWPLHPPVDGEIVLRAPLRIRESHRRLGRRACAAALRQSPNGLPLAAGVDPETAPQARCDGARREAASRS